MMMRVDSNGNQTAFSNAVNTITGQTSSANVHHQLHQNC